MSTPDPRIPPYLGRILAPGGEEAGTCFQLSPGVLVTAAHVVEELGPTVTVEPLGGGRQRDATVARLDALADLAVLVTDQALTASVAGLVATDSVILKTDVVCSGVAEVDDEDHTYGYLDALGIWTGGTTRDLQLPLGRLSSRDVLRGMSGAPVRRLSDDAVVGVVSGRYNAADGWLRDTVWVARTEVLEVLCARLADVTVVRAAPAGRIDLVLAVEASRVRLRGPGIDVDAAHAGVSPGLAGAVDDVRRRRARAGLVREAAIEADAGGTLALARAGQLLAERFLAPEVAAELARALGVAEAANQGLRLGIEVGGPLARLPWEALPTPGAARPLALHPLVDAYRLVPGAAVRSIPGPIRILVAIASPTEGGGQVLDYEAELRNVLDAVRAARAGAAHVAVVRFGSTAAISAALKAEDFHVLHLSAHGSPGAIVVEDDLGQARTVDADTFVDEAVPAGRMPPLVCLAACHTNVAAAAEAPSFAARLLQRGAAVVVATETTVTDRYATRLFARLYGRLAAATVPEVLEALCDAAPGGAGRAGRSAIGRRCQLAGLEEWSVVTASAPGAPVVLFDPATVAPVRLGPQAPRIGLVGGRAVGDFVGRRHELRQWPAELLDPGVGGLVLHGIGGVGKTTLAAEVVAEVKKREPSRLLAQLWGTVSVEDVLGEVADTLRRHLLMSGSDAPALVARAVELAARRDLPWRDRYAVLAEHALSAVPVLMVLDNFEDNLVDHRGVLVAPEVAELLACWLADPGLSRLLVTSRYRFSLPRSAEAALAFNAVGPLSFAETRKLVWSLPALDALSDDQVERIWRLVGGHPRSLEYLDALLSTGRGRYPDITVRLHDAMVARLGADDADALLGAERTLDAALAEVAVVAADDVLLPRLVGSLVPPARRLLVAASVFREPVDVHGLAFQVGQADEGAGSVPDRGAAMARVDEILGREGIATDGPIDVGALPAALRVELAPHLAELYRLPTPPRRLPDGFGASASACVATTLVGVEGLAGDEKFFVHRWTASELERLSAQPAQAGELAQAHRRAAEYWQWRVEVWPQDRAGDVHDLLEARHHLLAVDDVEGAGAVTEDVCIQLDGWGAWDQEEALVYDTLRRLPESSDRRWAWIHQLGILAQARGAYDEAEARYRQSLEINERLGNLAGMATSYHQLGTLAQDRGDYDEAEARYRQSLEIDERLGNPAGMAASYHQLGFLAQRRGDYDEAEARYRQSLEIKERLGNLAGMAATYHQLGTLAQDRGDYDEAEARYRQSLEINERLSNLADLAASYGQLGTLAQARGDYDDAEARYRQSLEITERLGNLAGMAAGYHQLGMLAQRRGDYDAAEARYRQSLEINERLSNLADMAASYHQLGFLAQVRGDYDGAEARYRQSLEISERLSNLAGMAASYSQLGILVAEVGSPSEAISWHVRALTLRLRLGVPQMSIDLGRLAELRRGLGPERFTEILARLLDDENRASLNDLLDQFERGDDADGSDAERPDP